MKPLFHGLVRAALVLYVLLAIVVLGVRYWLLPHIDQWRAPLEQALSVATDSEVQIGKLSAQWSGLLPQLQIEDLLLQSPQGKMGQRQQLRIPSIMASLKWQSLWERQLLFSHLRIEGLQVDLWRDTQQKIHLSGQTDDISDEVNKGFIAWLGQQGRVELKNAQLVWRDQVRGAMPLRVSQVHGVMQFTKEVLSVDLTASLQSELGQSVLLRGEFTRAGIEQRQLDGLVYVQFNELSPAAWRQWIDLPTDLSQATLDSQFWLQLQDSKIQHLSMDTRVYNGVWQMADGGQLKARSLRVFADAPWQGFKALADELPLGEHLQSGAFKLEVVGKQLALQNSTIVADNIQLDELRFRAERQIEEEEGLIQIQQLIAKNADVHVEIEGTWLPQGADVALGQFDLLGTLKSVQINQLYRYMPLPEVTPEVVEWLKHALVKGVIPKAVVRLKGDWHDFPYAGGQGGLFYIGGAFKAAEIDYYRPDPGEIGWPKVEEAHGYLALRNEGLWVSKADAVLRPNGKEAVQAKQVVVHIDNLVADEPILTIQGQTNGAAQAYLGLMSHSDLGALLGQAFTHSTATGQWQVPLALRINLENEDDIEVKGNIDFTDNTVQILPFLPPLERVKGRLHFNEKGARAEELKAQWLGGGVVIQDEIGPAGQMLKMQGQAHVNDLTKYIDITALDTFLDGGFNYQMQVGFDKNDQFYVKGVSDLINVRSTLPAPLAKSAEKTMPLELIWQAFNKDSHELQLRLDDKLHLQLVENPLETPLFSYGSLSWQQPLPALPTTKKGFVVDIKEDKLNLDLWQQAYEKMQLNLSAQKETVNSGKAFGLQNLMQLRLKTNQAVLVDHVLGPLTYTMQQTENHSWRADISSKPVAGTVQWQESASGEVLGDVVAKLQRVHWAPVSVTIDIETEKTKEISDFQLNLPNLKLTIEDLRWHQWQLGALQVEGVKQTNTAGRWQIPHLSLHTPYGDLNATGVLQQIGVERGLTLTAQAQSEQAGKLLKYIGIKEVLAEGRGSVHTKMQWLNFPWSTDLTALKATIDLDLYEGRIDQINSRAAKVLEFLSLQSLSRLSRLDFDIRGLFKDGFPFDDLKGRLDLSQQRLSTKDFRVMGPAGTIVIEGDTDIEAEQLDLRAVVVPNVDMSGAAIAAGIALNPVVGIGAFVTQLLFKDPLAKAMTVQYELLGPWDQFEAEEIKLKPIEPAINERN